MKQKDNRIIAKDLYEKRNLYVARIFTIIGGISYGYINVTSENKIIVEMVKTDNKYKYFDIFDKNIYQSEKDTHYKGEIFQCPAVPYLIDIEPISKYLEPSDYGKEIISIHRLRQLNDIINFPKEKSKINGLRKLRDYLNDIKSKELLRRYSENMLDFQDNEDDYALSLKI